MKNVNAILESGLAALDGANDMVELEQVKARFLGKSGELTGLLKQLGKLPAEERKETGAAINAAKQALRSISSNGAVCSRSAMAENWKAASGVKCPPSPNWRSPRS